MTNPTEHDAALDQLIETLQVKPQGDDVFVGRSQSIGTPNVFGGQVLGQALMAACLTAPEGRLAHSLHAYFLLPGRHDDITYDVARMRDGGSFSTRRVVARQGDAEIFEMLTSFHAPEPGFDRHDPMPSVPGPAGILSEQEHRQSMLDRIPERLRGPAIQPLGIEYRPVVPFDLMNPPLREARSSIWVRATGDVPDSPALNQALLAYASDHGLLLTASRPHGLSLLRGQVRMASLDHALWFHREFRMSEWLLYQVDSPSVSGGKAIARGAFYAADGRLVATVMQEGLMRPRTAAPAEA